MKNSVLIIAHNEEKYIEKCIESLLHQTKKADEIILIVHNSSDDTLKIAQKYENIKIIIFNGKDGIVSARIEGLKYVSNEMILCIDGDSQANKNWIEEMTKTLSNEKVRLVGSYVKFRGTFLGRLVNIFNKYFCKFGNATDWIWGTSFAFWKKDIEIIKEILLESELVSQKLELLKNPEDFWLALRMSQIGKLSVNNKTFVIQNQKEKNSLEFLKRNIKNIKNGEKIKEFFQKNMK